MTTEVNDIQKKYCSRAILLSLGIAGILWLVGCKPIARGLILGTLFSILNFVLIAQTMPLKFNKSRGKTFMVCLGSIWLRYILLALPLIIAANMERFEFFSAAAGLFVIQLVILLHHVGKITLRFSGKEGPHIPITRISE